MTSEEKQEIIASVTQAVLEQLFGNRGVDIMGLSSAQSLDGISTFPAIQTTTSEGVTTRTIVSVPVALLTQAVQTAIAQAETATSSARSAAAGWAAAANKMGSDLVVIKGNITDLQSTDNSLAALTSYAECSTAANVAAKTVAITDFALPANGGCLHIKMANANTAAAGVTLDVNSTGAKAMLYNGSAVSATNTWLDGEVIVVYYDGTNYQASNAQGGGVDYDVVTSEEVAGMEDP